MRTEQGEKAMKKLLLSAAFCAMSAASVQAETIQILMETVPDTRYIQDLLPEFKAATGIDVEIEAISYIDMHSKLVPQLSSPEGGYDAIVVDFYWVAEFTQANWMMPLDDLIKKDNVDTSVYVPSLMNLVGRVNDVTYMLPFYNYSMGIIYRKDMLADPKEQEAFKAKYGIDLKIPTTWDEYKKQVEFFTRDTDGDGTVDFYGTVNQGQRGDCIVMQWSNYLYANGGQYHDANWKATFDGDAGIKAVQDFRDDIAKHGPTGAESFCFDESANVFGQGKAYSFVTFNILLAGFDDPSSSQIVGKAGIAPNPNGGLNGGWGWAIPNSSANKEAAWKFIKWVESKEVVKKRTLAGGAPTQAWAFDDPDIVAKRPEMPQLKVLVETAQEFPVFTYTVDFVESLGRELNLAVTGQKDPKEAIAKATEDFNALAAKAGLQK
jgi:ABC-type glycerol-3-phosphate transport system substrate-binding protein